MSSEPYRVNGWLRGVLHAVSCNDLSERSTIAHAVGRACRAELQELVSLGYVRSTRTVQSDRTATTLYTITSKGQDALEVPAEAATPLQIPQATVTRQVERPEITSVAGGRMPISEHVYDGAELRPYEGRPGALDAFALPSLIGSERRYPRPLAPSTQE